MDAYDSCQKKPIVNWPNRGVDGTFVTLNRAKLRGFKDLHWGIPVPCTQGLLVFYPRNIPSIGGCYICCALWVGLMEPHFPLCECNVKIYEECHVEKESHSPLKMATVINFVFANSGGT
jgi:hypothetical protein